MNIKLIEYFHKEVPSGSLINYETVSKRAFQAGYVVDPACATEDVLKFLNEQQINPNSTFYATWQEIITKTREELFVDQILHYASTYGQCDPDKLQVAYTLSDKGTIDVDFGIDKNYVYVPNKNPVIVDWKKFKIIKPATVGEVCEDIMTLFRSGIALSKDTIDPCLEFLMKSGFNMQVVVNETKNKEVQATVASITGVYPEDEFSLLRVILYRYTGSATLIKSREVILTIKGENGFQPKDKFDFAVLTDKQLTALSRIFYRFKPLFLAMKGYADNAKYINKIRRLAVKNHKPLKKNFWDDCMILRDRDVNTMLETARTRVSELNNFKKVQLMQSIMSRIVGKNIKAHMYIIRNGKMFIRDNYTPETDTKYLMRLYGVLENALVEALRPKATTFCVTPGVHLTCPTSEKNFMGNYPIGTSVDFTEGDNVLGVYWRNDWGARDLDLHVYDENGQHLGWNASYYSNSSDATKENTDVIYSGDMTYAEPEAVEMLYFKKGVPDGFVNLNKFAGGNETHYKLFVAKENMLQKWTKKNFRDDDIEERYQKIMVDPNNIVMEAICDFTGPSQQTIAYLHNNRLYLMKVASGAGRVSLYDDTKIMQDANKVKADSYVDLIPILEKAGFTKVDCQSKSIQETHTVDVTGLTKEEAVKKVEEEMNKVETVEAGLDLTNPTKDVLIGLFS